MDSSLQRRALSVRSKVKPIATPQERAEAARQRILKATEDLPRRFPVLSGGALFGSCIGSIGRICHWLLARRRPCVDAESRRSTALLITTSGCETGDLAVKVCCGNRLAATFPEISSPEETICEKAFHRDLIMQRVVFLAGARVEQK